ncbi:Ubiquitin- modifier 1 [Coemansia sp. RSA 1813]|nr:Ubiquitin- modifier 1 [Coemansia sp. RSA 1646]KAJ1770686.1 Ubiquitin- modifier 1 [Coemansia sp. RSA 1843]KAJ2087336.1 Ubiquitin- modifier 1 [Coemansia sp. RSA 986]KAJ2215699.1 Ubiquitin- modifier 1 [Coemansia sp. RSA 487]KAJ2568445.1 Ubiquitin- modifier 1 [Coemansia sp. RSA 1813]
MAEKSENTINLSVEFSGGMELLMKDKMRKTQIDLPVSSQQQPTTTVRDLIIYIRDNVVAEKKELFSKDDTVCPGILVIINEIDWEVEDGIDTVLNNNDNVLFISTLHGG